MKKFLSLFVDMGSERPDAAPSPDVGDADLEALLKRVESTLEDAVPSEPPEPEPTALEWTLDQVFEAGGVSGGRNNADTVLTLKTSLAQFDRDQRRAMVRAMDAADDTWDEASVVRDAKERLLILQRFSQHIDSDEQAQAAAIQQAAADAKLANNTEIDSLKAQIQTLQDQLQRLVEANAAEDQKALDLTAAVSGKAAARHEEIKDRGAAYERLVAFFEG